ncbi:6107_t:CDS:2, partial [Cetraspora pellucida]
MRQNSVSKHNHAPELYKAEVAKVKNQIKKQAKETRDKPIKIVQDNVESSPQPQSIVELNMPESLKFTLSGNLFFIRHPNVTMPE